AQSLRRGEQYGGRGLRRARRHGRGRLAARGARRGALSMNAKKTLAILVGGGPAPGINAVLAAATIEARNHGLRVLGCYDGFKWLVQGEIDHVSELEINDTSRIHFDGGSIIRTSRTNPTSAPEGISRVAESLRRLHVDYLITIGGDDTAFSASRLARAMP